MSERSTQTRREWLRRCTAVAGATAGLAGCLDGGDDGSNENGGNATNATDGDAETNDGVSDFWQHGDLAGDEYPIYGVDPALTGFHPNASPPSDDVTIRWETELVEDDWINENPRVADGTVFVNHDHWVWAVDLAEGSVQWTADVQEIVNDGFEVNGALALVDDLVIVPLENSGVAALDRETGDDLWYEFPEGSSWYNVHEYDGSLYTLDHRDDRIARFDPETRNSEVIYEFESDLLPHSDLAIKNGIAVFTDSEFVHAVDLEAGEQHWLWEHPDGNTVSDAGVTIADGLVYASASRRLVEGKPEGTPGLFAIDLESGEEEWRTLQHVDAMPVSPAVSEDVVIATSTRSKTSTDESTIYGVDRETGEERWEQETVLRKPTIADGVVYVSNTSGVHAFDLESGDERWSWAWSNARSGMPHSANFGEPVTVVDDAVVLSGNGDLIVLESA